MNDNIKFLLEYQEIDKNLITIESEISKSEIAVKYSSAVKFLKTVNDSLEQINEKAEKLLSKYNSILASVENYNKQIETYNKTAEKTSSEDEIVTLKKKFDETYSQIATLEGELSKCKKEMEELNKEFVILYNKRKQMKEQYEENKPLYEKLKDEKKGDIDKIKVTLDKLRVNIPADLMKKYDNRRKDKKFPILLKVEKNDKMHYCPLCRTVFAISAVNNLLAGEIKECENERCHVLVYAE